MRIFCPSMLLGGLVLSGHAMPGYAHSCQITKPCIGCAVEAPHSFDRAEEAKVPGSEFGSQMGTVQGSELVYSGAAHDSFLIHGFYYDMLGSQVSLNSSVLEISTNWQPATYDTCRRRNWTKKCISWTTHNHETGFMVDYTFIDPETNERVVLTDMRFVNQNNLNHERVVLPMFECHHDVKGFEVRVRGLYGGSVDFTVHRLILNYSYNY